MAVYREGYDIVSQIEKQSVRIYSDACDYGAPVRQGDALWNNMKQLIEWYGVEGSVKRDQYGCSAEIFLMDEWAVSDQRKTMKEAEDIYNVSYNKCTDGECKGFDGYIVISKRE